MKRTPYYHWILDSETPPGKRIRSRWTMSEEEAKGYARRNPVRIDPPAEWRDLPETPEEIAATLGQAHFRP